MNKEKRRKLSDAAIAFIIEERDNPHTVYTFEEIAKLVEKKFEISIGRGAVSESYHKHKNNEQIKILSKEHSNQHKVKPQIKDQPNTEPYVAKKKIRDFDEDAGKGISIDHLL